LFKHILLPTDGSRLSERGVKAGIKLAKALGAKVTGVYVVSPYAPVMYADAMYIPPSALKQYQQGAESHGAKVLAKVERDARAAGVPCATQVVTSAPIWEGILKVARARKCDAITMASHGRGGLGGLLLGSETSRVLSHSKIPVLVTR
jgi:nucleotide-binding universal stress UspA family protein